MKHLLLITIFTSLALYSIGQVKELTVINTLDDSNPGSFRWAIENSNPGANFESTLIQFDIPGSGPHTIALDSLSFSLDMDYNRVVIDATTQPDYYQGIIRLDVGFPGFYIYADSCELYGIQIQGSFQSGLYVYGDYNQIGAPGKGNIINNHLGDGIVVGEVSKYNVIQSNIIRFSGGAGISCEQGESHLVGGAEEDEGNILENNQVGMDLGYMAWLYRIQNNLFSNNSTGMIVQAETNECYVSDNDFYANGTAMDIDYAFSTLYLANNRFYCNTISAIETTDATANPPSINFSSKTTISGFSAAGDTVRIYAKGEFASCSVICEGEVFVDEVIADGNGNWSLSGLSLVAGTEITATTSNTFGNTSSFADCIIVPCEVTDVIVTTTEDTFASGTIRMALYCAEVLPSPQTISFNLPGEGPHVFTFGSDFSPEISANNVTLDGTTQPDFKLGDIVFDGNMEVDEFIISGAEVGVFGIHFRNFTGSGLYIFSISGITIGEPGKGNIFTNNLGSGILLEDVDGCTIRGNFIGTSPRTSGEFSDMGNAAGIQLYNTQNIQIGGSNVREGNVIAYNTVGVWLDTEVSSTIIQSNRMFCNPSGGIFFEGPAANDGKQPPEILDADLTEISGAGPPLDTIEVFLSRTDDCDASLNPCQGNIFIGKTVVGGDGKWSLPTGPSIAGLSVTATATNTVGSTSEFSNCKRATGAITVEEVLEVPEAITPNFDGANDAWKITNIEAFPNNELIILNRWGNQVYYAKPYQNDWAGTTSGGQPLMRGTYFYILRVQQPGLPRETIRGAITIVK